VFHLKQTLLIAFHLRAALTRVHHHRPTFRSASCEGANRRRFGINEFGARVNSCRKGDHSRCHFLFLETCFFVVSWSSRGVWPGNPWRWTTIFWCHRRKRPEENEMAGEADLMRNVLLEACTHDVFHVAQHVDKGLDQTIR
jgi:hypothetical protein